MENFTQSISDSSINKTTPTLPVVEKFSFSKWFKSWFTPLAWIKSFTTTFRGLIIIGLVIGAIYFLGYRNGFGNKPINIGLEDRIITLVEKNTGEKHTLKIEKGLVYFDGTIVTNHGIKELRPYGIYLQPKFFLAAPIRGSASAGVGASVAHYYKWNLDVMYLIPDIVGVGISYDLNFDSKWLKITNSSIGVGAGRGIKYKDTVFYIYYSVKF